MHVDHNQWQALAITCGVDGDQDTSLFCVELKNNNLFGIR